MAEGNRQRGPFTVAYPVDFTSKGDTTRDAFRKHMDEIARIYGILTALDAATLDANDVSEILQRHIDSANPHPNYKPNIAWNDLTSKPSLEDLSGNLDASRVVGKLTNATIDTGNINGLSTYLSGYLSGQIPADKGDGITQSSLNENGYAKFKNGLIIQWGKMILNTGHELITQTGGIGFDGDSRISFPTQFPTKCFSVVATLGGFLSPSATSFYVYDLDVRILVTRITNSYFWYYSAVRGYGYIPQPQVPDYMYANYLAIGV